MALVIFETYWSFCLNPRTETHKGLVMLPTVHVSFNSLMSDFIARSST
jgi:hypothetical protein